MLIDKFMQTEIISSDVYDAVMNFICSNNIRNGEYEGNEYIIKKMDNLNIIIYLEYETPTYPREISEASSIYRKDLINKINKYARQEGIEIQHWLGQQKLDPLTILENRDRRCGNITKQLKQGQMEIVNFLKPVILCQKEYDDLVDFIDSYNIRIGEYKREQCVIKKLDRRNFILYYENEWTGPSRDVHDEWDLHPKEISHVTHICRRELLDIINVFAKDKQLLIRTPTD